MTDLQDESSNAIEPYDDFAATDFESFEVGQAKQMAVPYTDGYSIGDADLFRLADEQFFSVGAAAAHS